MNRLPNPRALLRTHFFSGLLVVIPLGAIAWITIAVFRVLWGLQNVLPESWQPENVFPNPWLAHLFELVMTISITLVLAIAISILGWTSKQILGRKILELLAEIIQHIPLLRSVYSALDQLLRTIAAGGGQQFSRVVYVEYPRRGSWTLAFVTGVCRAPSLPEGKHLNIYVPTTPNPTSGFYLIVPEAEVRETHMKVEDAFKTLLSLGIAQNVEPIPARPAVATEGGGAPTHG